MEVKAQQIKACVHCKHMRQQRDKVVCAAIDAMQKWDLVLGELERPSAYAMRNAAKGQCGKEGKLWEERPNNVEEANAYVEHAAANVPEFVPAGQYYRERFARLGAAWLGAARWVIGLPGRAVAAIVIGVQGAILALALASGAVKSTPDEVAAEPMPETKEGDTVQPVTDPAAPEVEPAKEGDTSAPAPTPPPVVEIPVEPAKPETPTGELIPFDRNARDEAKLGTLVAGAAIALVLGAIVANQWTQPAMPTRAASMAERPSPCRSDWPSTREHCCPKGEGKCYPCTPAAAFH